MNCEPDAEIVFDQTGSDDYESAFQQFRCTLDNDETWETDPWDGPDIEDNSGGGDDCDGEED